MIRLTAKILVLGVLFAGCAKPDAPESTRSVPLLEAPAVEPPAEVEPEWYDSLGRLIPGKMRLDGFPFPRLVREITPEGAPTRSFELPALKKPVLEFYSHRDFHVIEMRRGYKIQHSTITRERNGKDEEGLGSLVLFERSQRNQLIRYLPAPATPPKPPADTNQEKKNEDPTGLRESQVEIRDENVEESTGAPAVKPVRRVVVPFNPGIPRSMGKIGTSERVKRWRADNPGKTFYD